MKIIAVVPTYNEQKAIADVVARAKKYVTAVVVSDDLSKDLTCQLAKESGANVILNPKNHGAGGNTWHGMELALDSIYHGEIIVTLDGDGQHNADEIPLLLKPILMGEADFVIGSRFEQYKNSPLYRRLGISVITYAYNIFHKVKVDDSQSGFRAYNRKVLESCPITETGFAFSVETLVKFRAKGFRIKEVPIKCIYHKELIENSSMNPIKHGLKVLWAVIKWRVLVEVLKRGN